MGCAYPERGHVNRKQVAVMICVTPDGKVLYQSREKKERDGVVDFPLEQGTRGCYSAGSLLILFG